MQQRLLKPILVASILLILLGLVYQSFAASTDGASFLTLCKTALQALVDSLSTIIHYPVFGFPIIVLALIITGVFFTFRLGFINIRLFGHAIAIVRGKYSSPNDPGEVTHFQALSAAVSATVGIGNIAGVAIAVTLGGPGAVVWMAIAGILGMSTKFAEVTLGQKYRHIDKNGVVSGGAFHYLEDGLADINKKRLGRILAIAFAALCACGALGIGNMFQSNQAVSILTERFDLALPAKALVAFLLAGSVALVIIGGIKRIAHVAEAIVPLMALIYVSGALVVLFMHRDQLSAALIIMFQEAFSSAALGGGAVGAIIVGFQRAVFSNESGIGSAPIAHAAAKTKEPVREGCVSLLEPFIDTVVICFLTGLVITVTGVYQDTSIGDGILLSSAAFASAISWFPWLISIAAVLFAYSTMISWSYYGERSWEYLFGPKAVMLYRILFASAAFLGGMLHVGLILDLSDLFVLMMAVPNLIGLFLLQKVVRQELDKYLKKVK